MKVPKDLDRIFTMRLAALLAALMLPLPASAWNGGLGERTAEGRLDNASFLDATYLIELKQGSHLSALARSLGAGGFETATGSRVDFHPWYSSRWTDASITWMTQVTRNFGIIHGFSTGERGSKYTIAPSVKLGVMLQVQTGRHAFLSFRATTRVGGDLREKSCTADYGDIGGVQAVNCRLAASPLQPTQTLDYLVREKPLDRNQASLVFQWHF